MDYYDKDNKNPEDKWILDKRNILDNEPINAETVIASW